MSVAEANGLRSASEASAKQTMSGGGDVSVLICSTCGSGLRVAWCLNRGKKSVEFIKSRRSTKERDRYVHSKSQTWMKCSCAVPMTNAPVWSQITTKCQNPVLTREIRHRSHPWLKRPACPLVMGRNGGVRQHHGENAVGGCKWNPLRLQK